MVVPVLAPNVVVAMTKDRLDVVAYSKPLWVTSVPPRSVIDPIMVMVEVPTDKIEVVTVGIIGILTVVVANIP